MRPASGVAASRVPKAIGEQVSGRGGFSVWNRLLGVRIVPPRHQQATAAAKVENKSAGGRGATSRPSETPIHIARRLPVRGTRRHHRLLAGGRKAWSMCCARDVLGSGARFRCPRVVDSLSQWISSRRWRRPGSESSARRPRSFCSGVKVRRSVAASRARPLEVNREEEACTSNALPVRPELPERP